MSLLLSQVCTWYDIMPTSDQWGLVCIIQYYDNTVLSLFMFWFPVWQSPPALSLASVQFSSLQEKINNLVMKSQPETEWFQHRTQHSNNIIRINVTLLIEAHCQGCLLPSGRFKVLSSSIRMVRLAEFVRLLLSDWVRAFQFPQQLVLLSVGWYRARARGAVRVWAYVMLCYVPWM